MDSMELEKEIPEDLKEQAEEHRQKLIEALADFDDTLAEKFLNEEKVSAEELYPVARKATLDLKTTSVFMDSAYKNKGFKFSWMRFLPSRLSQLRLKSLKKI